MDFDFVGMTELLDRIVPLFGEKPERVAYGYEHAGQPLLRNSVEWDDDVKETVTLALESGVFEEHGDDYVVTNLGCAYLGISPAKVA